MFVLGVQSKGGFKPNRKSRRYNALSDCCNTARQRKLGDRRDRRLGLLNQVHGKEKVLIWEIYGDML